MEQKKKTLPQLVREYPVITCIALVIVYIICRRITHWLFAQVFSAVPVREILDVIWPFIIVMATGCLMAYKKRGFFKTLVLCIPLMIYGLINWSGNIVLFVTEPGIEWKSPLRMIISLLPLLAVGFREESVFRGVAVNIMTDKYAKDRRGILFIVLFTGFCFGIMHMQNIFIGQSLLSTIEQSLNAVCLGIIFAAVYLRGGNLWALMLIHSFIDIGGMSRGLLTKTYDMDAIGMLASNKETTIDPRATAVKAGIWIACVLAGLFMIRKSKCDEIIAKFRKNVEV
ncbi:MAG: CPBP family intramembrane metalloprotease [Lachnospiraceae bacterium]|nr:CPBP family intramembrane metalloprotease [Lachnospiraceae bacterium]